MSSGVAHQSHRSATAGVVPWAALATANQRAGLRVPWAVLPAALYLWLLWRYLRGEGWPRATGEARRRSLRANRLPGDLWGMALFAGLLGLTGFLPLVALMNRVVAMPAESQPIRVPPEMPFPTVLLLLVMGSVVAGVVEEAAFRGYMQGPIERRHGPVVAVLATGALFGAAHVTHHPDAVLPMMPYYLYVAAVYGGLACATDSILPGLVLHAGGDVLSLTRLWATGQPEWRVSAAPPRLIWQTGPDAEFWGYLAAFILLGAATLRAYSALAAAARAERGNG